MQEVQFVLVGDQVLWTLVLRYDRSDKRREKERREGDRGGDEECELFLRKQSHCPMQRLGSCL